MSRIFLSHSSTDELEAVALKEWLAHNGWDDVFLDLDPQRGLLAGERWQEALRRAADRCEVVVFVVTPAWAKSKWCLTEFLLAKSLNKRIFGAILKPVALSELPVELTAEWQLSQLVGEGPKETITFTHKGQAQQIEFLADGLTRLRIGLDNAGLDAHYFPWPPSDDPQRPPYRGLSALEEKDAAIFFGRDAQIVRGLDALRGMRAGGAETLFVILGPSGTGKSSFLRAGLLPRLKRDDRHFLPLDVIRPERHTLTGEYGLAMAIHKARLALGLSGQPLGAIKAALGQGVSSLVLMLAELQQAAHERLRVNTQGIPPPTLVLAVDQTEELFNPDTTDEARRFLTLIGETLRDVGSNRPSLIVAFTIRSDRYEPLQTAPELAGLKSRVFDDLKPMPPSQFKEVITGPARRATEAGGRLEIKPDLVERLLGECAQGADTLPLLSLTLARLYREYGSDGDLRLDEYEAMGGMQSVVKDEIESMLAYNPAERQAQLEHLRAAFIPWLATINPQNNEPMRRVARISDLPPESHQLIEALLEKRLLLSDQREGERVVEVAHDALLRQWDKLADWLRDEGDKLKFADALEHAAQDWKKNDRKDPWLMVGERLSNAEALAVKAGFQKRLEACREFLLASRQWEDAREEEEKRRQKAELDAAQRLATEQSARADAEAKARADADASAARIQGLFRSATGLRLVAEAQGMLTRERSGGDERALLKLLAAQRIATDTEVEGALLSGLLLTRNLKKIIVTGESVIDAAINYDGSRIVSCSEDSNLRLWDANTGQLIGEPLLGHEDAVTSVAFSPDGTRIVSGSDDRTLRLWDTNTGQLIGEPLLGHEDAVTSVAFSPDGTRIVSGSDDHTLRLWDTNTGQPIGKPLQGHDDSVNSVAFILDGRRIASIDESMTMRLWDAKNCQPIGESSVKPRRWDWSAAFSPDGNRMISGGKDKTLCLWDVQTGQPIGEPLEGHENEVNSIAFSPDGTRVVSGSRDKTLRLWDADTGQPIGEPLRGHEEAVVKVAFSPDGSRIVSVSEDDTLRLWDANPGQFIGVSLAGHSGGVEVAVFSPDGGRIVSGSRDKSLRLWDANTGQPIGEPLEGHGQAVTSIAFSPDGGRIVSGSSDKTLRLWDANTGQPIGEPLQGHGNEVCSVAFILDSAHIISGSLGGTVRLWDALTFQPIGNPLLSHAGWVTSVAFSPDGSRIVSGSRDGTVRLWDASTDQLIGAPLQGHSLGVNCVAFSPDCSRIVSGSKDATLCLWDANTGKPIGEPLREHTSEVRSAAFSPDGHHIVSGSRDETLRLWDGQTGQSIGVPLQGHEGWVETVAFSPDGRHVVSGSLDGTLRLWPAPKAWTEELCKKLPRNMSHKQWREWVSPEIDFVEQCPGLPIPPDAPISIKEKP